MILDHLFSGKIRLKLLMRLFINPDVRVFLRGLEREFDVSSNTVRIEINKLQEMNLIQEYKNNQNTKVKEYGANQDHPMFIPLRNILIQYAGLDGIVDHIFEKLGKVEYVFLTGDLAEGKNSNFIDLIAVGHLNKIYLINLIDKVESLTGKKVRIATFKHGEFSPANLEGVGPVMQLFGNKEF
jgi:hypothetical protein